VGGAVGGDVAAPPPPPQATSSEAVIKAGSDRIRNIDISFCLCPSQSLLSTALAASG